METYFILTEAMYQSLGQAIVVYLASRAVLLSFPHLTAESRYKVLYLAHCLIFILFLGNIYSITREWAASTATAREALAAAGTAPVRFVSLRSLIMANAPTIGAVYFLGLIVQLLLLIPGLIRLEELKRGEYSVPEIWVSKLEHWRNKLGMRRQIKVVSGRKAGIPFTAGFLKPVIYLPITAFNNLTTEQAEAILLHELAHIHRNDYLFNLIQKGIEIVMFFNPVSWALGAEIRKEREFCCDDLVVSHSDPQLYARALFLLEEHRTARLNMALAATGNENNLLERIKRITQMKTNQLTLKPGIYALLGFLAVGLSVAWIAPEATITEKHHNAAKPAAVISINSRLGDQPFTAFADTVPTKDSAALKKYFNSREWKQHMEEVKKHSEEVKKHFESAEWKKQMADVQKHSQELQKHFQSPEWKKHMEDLKIHSEELSREIQKQFNSPEWKKQQEMMAQHGEKMKKHFESPEWKARMQDMEKLGVEMEKKFNSPEWKEKMQKLELQSKELEKKFESPEWKARMKEMEKVGAEMEKKFNSPEWKEKMKKLELQNKELERKFESPEWKNKMKELELRNKELEKKFNSPEWKKKMEELDRQSAGVESEL